MTNRRQLGRVFLVQRTLPDGTVKTQGNFEKRQVAVGFAGMSIVDNDLMRPGAALIARLTELDRTGRVEIDGGYVYEIVQVT